MTLPGNPSDETPGVLRTGNGDISTLFVSMARRHPDGADADYLRWHTLDHRPEQHRLSAVRASLRLVSTPRCRDARAASRPPYDEIDHVMTYFFTAPTGLDGFLLDRDQPIDGLADVDGIAGTWTTRTLDVDPKLADAPADQWLTYCFLDDDPVAVAERLKPLLRERNPLLAAPFHAIVPHHWDRYVP